MIPATVTPPSGVRKKTLGVRRRLPSAAAPLLPRLTSSTSATPHRPAAATVRRASRSVSPPPLLPPPSQPSMEAALASIDCSLDSFDAATASCPLPRYSQDDDDDGDSSPASPIQRERSRPNSNGASHSPTSSPLLHVHSAPRRPGRPRSSTTPVRPMPASRTSLSPRPSTPSRRRRRRSGEEEDLDEEKAEREEKALDDLIDTLDRDSAEDDGEEEERIKPETHLHLHTNGALRGRSPVAIAAPVKRKPGRPRKVQPLPVVEAVEPPKGKVGRPRESAPPAVLANGAAREAAVELPVKRKPGRPRKVPLPAPAANTATVAAPPRRRATAPPSSASAAPSPAPASVKKETKVAAPSVASSSSSRPPAKAAGILSPVAVRGSLTRPPPEVKEAARPEQAKGGKRGPVVVDEQRLREINRVLRDLQQLGRPWSTEQVRRLIHVSPHMGALIKEEFDKNGPLSVDAYKAVLETCREKRRVEKSKLLDERRGKSNQDDDGEQPRRSKAKAGEEGKAKKRKKKPAIGEGDGADLSVDGWKYLHSAKWKAKKRRKTDNGEADEADFEEILAQEAVQQRKHSLRRRQKVDYSAQLENDPLTIIDLTWYPTKASQPFRVLIDPIIPVILDVHSHLADTEVIGVLSGEWLPSQSLLVLRSAYPCQTLSTDNDLVNVEMDPTSLVAVSSHIEEQGSHIVGWYHSHPYFRNQPSMVDVENQRKYQDMFQRGGDDVSGSPFIGAIVTPYGQEGFKPLPSNVKWFFHKEGKGRGGGDGAGLGSGDYEGGGTPMELWTDVGEDEEKGAAMESHAELLSRLVKLCTQYGEHPTRVDFQEEWQAAEGKEVGQEEGLEGSQSGASSPSGMSPKGRRRTADEVRAIRCKLDQFRASLTQHVELMDRWDGRLRRIFVDRVVDAVSRWQGRPSKAPKKKTAKSPQRQRSTEAQDGEKTEDDVEEDEEEDDDDSREEEHIKEGSSEEF